MQCGGSILKIKDRIPAAEIDLEIWENRSDGLIFFDAAGTFTGCSPKMQKLAGSIDAVREALAGFSWPRAFALGSETVSIFRQAVALSPEPKEFEFRCVRTAEGFLAAIAPAQGKEQRVNDLLLDIFSAHIRERRAISRHLHGALTQDLVALSLSLSSMRDEESRELSEAIGHVDRCCRGVRVLSYVLAPPAFLDSDLMETISWYGAVLRNDAGMDFALEADALAADPPEEIKSLFFAALQQMAAAAIWRPEDARLHVELKARGGTFSMRVDCACHPDEPPEESPLIRERARALGGWTRLVAKPDATTLEISVPWSEAE